MPEKKTIPESKLDRLSALISQFRIEARVMREDPPISRANFFIVAKATDGNLCQQKLLFFPHNKRSENSGSEDEMSEYDGEGDVLVRAFVDTGGSVNPITLALPEKIEIDLDQDRALQDVTSILLEETLQARCGGQAVIDRLCEVVVIRMLRHLIEVGQAKVGLLAGLAHPNLSRAIVAMHENPDRDIQLEELSEIAAMSRTHFVNSFKQLVGVTPGQYLSSWRLTLARTYIQKGEALKSTALRVGFSSSAALSRAFTREFGLSPREFRKGAL